MFHTLPVQKAIYFTYNYSNMAHAATNVQNKDFE